MQFTEKFRKHKIFGRCKQCKRSIFKRVIVNTNCKRTGKAE